MNDIIFSGVFEAGCDLVVVPISDEATISSSFLDEMYRSRLNVSPFKDAYILGEVEFQKIVNHKTVKYIAFVCTVSRVENNNKALERIARKLSIGTKRKSTITRIAIPLLGTGAGGVSVKESLEKTFKSFYSSCRKGVDLIFCIIDRDTYSYIKSHYITQQGVSLFRVKQLILENRKFKRPRLDLGMCGLRNFDLIPELFECTHLQELILSNEWGEFNGGEWIRRKSSNKGVDNVFNYLDKRIQNLIGLKVLIAGGNWIVKSRSSVEHYKWGIADISILENLNHLTILNVSNNLVEKVGKLDRLRNLTKLHLNNNKISHIPSLQGMVRLRELNLSNNNIEDLQFLGNCIWIKTIDLHSNRVKDLTPIKSVIAKIGISDNKWGVNTLNIALNKLESPLPEVISQGKDKVIAYLEQEEAEKDLKLAPVFIRDIKLILVGNSHAGKSSLLYWIKNGAIDKTISTTHWLETDKLHLNIADIEYTIRSFDFGGQEYYHDSHHLFFTNNAIYLVVWDKLSNKYGQVDIEQKQLNGFPKNVKIQTYPLTYWMESIGHFKQRRKKKTYTERQVDKLIEEKKSELIEHADDIQIGQFESASELKVEKVEENILVIQNKVDKHGIEFLNQKSLKLQFAEIFDFVHVSVHEEIAIALLKQKLEFLIQNAVVVNKPYLQSWKFIKSRIESAEFETAFSISEFQEYCNQAIRELPGVLNIGDKISQLLFDRVDAESFAQYLNDIGFLLYFPENTAISDRVFVNQQKILHNIYKITLDLEHNNGQFNLQDATKKIGNNEAALETIELMLQFRIIFQLPGNKNTYVAPLFLPSEPFITVKLFTHLFDYPSYKYYYQNFAHKHIILDFFQRYGNDVLKEQQDETLYYFWRYGIILKDQITSEVVMIKFTEAEESKEGHVEIFPIKSVGNGDFAFRIAAGVDIINDGWGVVKMVASTKGDLVPIEHILKNEQENKWVFEYRKNIYYLTDFKKFLVNPIKMKKIFISYSKADSNHLQKLENHLSILRRNGTIATWNCRKLVPGEKWDGKIRQELEEADLILFLVSDDFLATDYIWDVEIKRAIERENDPNDNVIVVPIIVRSCCWEESPLGVYNTAPAKAQVIVSSDDIDSSWTKVVKEIKAIL
jgi:internalin A